jgi:chromosome segregation ATPase
LAAQLQEAYGLTTGEELELFVDRESLVWGDAWKERIAVAIAGTTFFIPFLTPRYFESSECRQELLKFLGEARRGGVEQLLLPVYYVTVEELDGEPTDELMIAVKERQWEDLREIRLLDEDSSQYRTAVERLAERIASIARAVSQVPDVSAQALERSEGSRDLLPEDNEPEGIVEKLGKGEEALNEIAGTLGAMAAENETLGQLAMQATDAIHDSDARQRGFAGRMAVAQRYAESLQEPAAKIQMLGEKYTSELMTVHEMSSTILEAAESSQEQAEEVAPYLRSLVELDDSAAEAIESTRGLIRTMQENAKLSRSLRPPTRQIATGLQAFMDGGAIIREWADRARRLLKDMDSPGEGMEDA